MKIFLNKNNNGFAALVTIFVIMGLILIITLSITEILSQEKQISRRLLLSSQSYYSAESGVEDGVLRVRKNYNYTVLNNFDLDGSDIEQNITQNGNVTTIESLSSRSGNERKLKTVLVVTKDDISFHYGVQVGEGGLTMGNNSTIVGNLYSDGNISGNPGAQVTGDVFVATGMTVGHQHQVFNAETVFGNTAPIVDVGQSFKSSASGYFSQVSFYIKKIGNPADKVIRVFTDDGSGGALAGKPTKTELASTTLYTSKIGSSYGWVNYSFSSPASLVSSVWYWMVIDTSTSVSKYFSIAKDSDKGDGNGVSKYTPDWNVPAPVWTEDTGDFNFKVWIGGNPTYLDSVIAGGDAHANTISNSTVNGDAYYQSIISSTVSGTSYPDSPDPPVEALPISDSNVADWKLDATNAGVLNSSLCTATTDIVLDSGVLDCDFTPDPGIDIVLNGTVWVKGNITFGNGTRIKLSSGYGGNSGIIIADKPGSLTTSGKIYVENGVVICGTQGFLDMNTCNPSNDTYILMLSTHSGSATYAIDVRNNASGAIFYAHKGTANVKNGADLKEVTAYKLNLEERASVTYESGLANASFTSGPGGGWSIDSWNEIE